MKGYDTYMFVIIAIVFTGYIYLQEKRKNETVAVIPVVKTGNTPLEKVLRLKEKAASAEIFAKAHAFNTAYSFLIDMSIASGKKRFFIYNMPKDSVEVAGLVTHGSGSEVGETKLYFSNTPNSNCTSLGKYSVGKPYTGKIGLAYKLNGLEKTNSKAFQRFVVLHAHSCVPVFEVDPLSICESWGCPTVSPTFLKILETYISKSKKPVLLWIYY